MPTPSRKQAGASLRTHTHHCSTAGAYREESCEQDRSDRGAAVDESRVSTGCDDRARLVLHTLQVAVSLLLFWLSLKGTLRRIGTRKHHRGGLAKQCIRASSSSVYRRSKALRIGTCFVRRASFKYKGVPMYCFTIFLPGVFSRLQHQRITTKPSPHSGAALLL